MSITVTFDRDRKGRPSARYEHRFEMNPEDQTPTGQLNGLNLVEFFRDFDCKWYQCRNRTNLPVGSKNGPTTKQIEIRRAVEIAYEANINKIMLEDQV